jgi:regulatory protein
MAVPANIQGMTQNNGMIRPTRRTATDEEQGEGPAPLSPVRLSERATPERKASFGRAKSKTQKAVDDFEAEDDKSTRSKVKSSFGSPKKNGFKEKKPKLSPAPRKDAGRGQGPKVPRQMTQSRVRNIAEYYVSQRDCSQHMLRTMLTNRLRRRGFTQDAETAEQEKIEAEVIFEAEIKRLVDLGVIDDARYAEARSRTWLGQGRAQRRILMDLQRKGIDADTAQVALGEAARETTGQYSEDVSDEHVAETAEWEAAETLARKKRIGPYRTTPAPKGRDELAKLWRREAGKMARAGFGIDIIRQILDREPEQDEEF